MTQNTMTCESFNDRLMPYLEHETDDATRAALERHAVTCAECGALLADLRTIRADASNLPELAPSRDLWSGTGGIAARIEAPVVPIGTVRQIEQDRRSVVGRWMRGGAIAASLLAAAGVGYVASEIRSPSKVAVVVPADQPDTLAALVVSADSASGAPTTPRGTAPRTTPTPTSPPAAAPTGGQVAAQVAVARLTADYDREIARLRELIEQRRNQLDPATVAIIERNLQVIDTAIVESKKAIAGDPASRYLIESLNQSLQSKVELMRTAALLPLRT